MSWFSRRRMAAGVVLAGCAAAGEAQDRPRLSGYYEHQLQGGHNREGWTYLDYDRFRVNLDATAGRGVTGSVGVVYQLFRGDTRVQLRTALPPSLAALADTFAVDIEDRHFVNHVFVSLRAGPVEVVAGKQYLAWGAAAVFNPTELFRPKNPFEPGYDREGVGALSTKFALGQLSELQVALVPEGGFETSGKLLRARHHVAGFDLSALVAETHEAPTPTGLGSEGSPLQRRITVGGDFSGEVLGLGVWGEATWSDFAGRQWVEATVGGNYTLGDGTLVTLEGFFNGRGESTDPYSAVAWLGRIAGDRRALGRVLVYGLVSRKVGQLWTVGGSVISNPGDGSGAVIPSVAYSFAQNVDLLFNGIVAFGGDESEFGSGSQSAFLRARVYF